MAISDYLKPKKALSLFLLLFIPGILQAEEYNYETILKLMHLREYRIVTKSDTIYFLATLPDKKKKTIIFCSGSGPVPLFVKMPEGIYPCAFPFEIDSNTRSQFNIVVISKPGIKRFATVEDISPELAKQYQFLQLDSDNRPPQKYIRNNSLYKLGGDGIAVVKFLKKQPWIDKENIYLFGHSQGAMVAAYVASKMPGEIKGLIYAQGNAYGIHAEYLSSIIYNQSSITDVNKMMDSVYKLHKYLVNGIPDKELDSIYQWKEADLFDKKKNDFYDLTTNRWRSLEEPPGIEYLLKTNCSVLLVQGLNSPGDMDNKNIPLDFVRHHKRNLTTLFYPGYDHNYFKQATDEKGNRKEPEQHWNDIFNDVKKWILSGR